MKPIEMKEGGTLYRFFTRFNFNGTSHGYLLPHDSCEFFTMIWRPLFLHLLVIWVLQSWTILPLSILEGTDGSPRWVESYGIWMSFALFMTQVVSVALVILAIVIVVLVLVAAGIFDLCRYLKKKWFSEKASEEESGFTKGLRMIHAKAKKYCIPIEWK